MNKLNYRRTEKDEMIIESVYYQRCTHTLNFLYISMLFVHTVNSDKQKLIFRREKVLDLDYHVSFSGKFFNGGLM